MRLSFGLPLLALLLSGCDALVDPPPRLRLMGTVRDAATGAPVPGAKVGLLTYAHRDGWRETVALAEVSANAEGRYSLSHPVSRAECARLELRVTLDHWNNAGYSSDPDRPLLCTSVAQRIDVRLRVEPF